MCTKLTIKTPEHRSSVFIAKFEHTVKPLNSGHLRVLKNLSV